MTGPRSITAESEWARPVLVGCCPSSGSTLLSVILDHHPRMCCGPELALLTHPFLWTESGERWRQRVSRCLQPGSDERLLPDWTSEAGVCEFTGFCSTGNLKWYGTSVAEVLQQLPGWNGVDALLRHLFRRRLTDEGRSIWVEKTPTNLFAMREFLDHFPRGRGVVLIRDGRDVVCSLLKRGYSFARAAATWVLEAALSLALARHKRVCLLKYEDLVLEPRTSLQALMDFLQVETSIDRLLDHASSRRARHDPTIRLQTWTNSPQTGIRSTAVGRWHKELSPLQVFLLESLTLLKGYPGLDDLAGMNGGALLAAHGYAPASDPSPALLRSAGDDGAALVQSFVDPTVFHQRHVVPDLGSVLSPLDLFALLNRPLHGHPEHPSLLHKLVEGEKDLAAVRSELSRRIGFRNGIKEVLRALRSRVGRIIGQSRAAGRRRARHPSGTD